MIDRLIQLVIQFIELFRVCFILQPFEAGVVTRLGHLHRTVGPGGLHWILPFRIEDYIYTNIVPETSKVGPQSLTTKDEVGIVVSAVITFAIKDVATYLLAIEGAEQVIEDATVGYVSEYIRNRNWTEILATDINGPLTTLVRRRAKEFGVDIIRVQIADFSKCMSIRHLTNTSPQMLLR